jgi:hypothetical protein
MLSENKKLIDLVELANHYPSPHNGQPVELAQKDSNSFDLYFCKERGLQAVEVSLLFSYVTMGVFIHHLSLSAKALGHSFTYGLELPPVAAIKGNRRVKFASCGIKFDSQAPDEALRGTLLFRQTSRKKYSEGLSNELSDRTIKIAAGQHMELVKMNRRDAHQAIWLNQRAVFDDMFDDNVRKELNHWLRYSKSEKEAKKDGLAYDCMELNGQVMRFIVNHYKLLHAPVISSFLKQYYLRTMSDQSDVYYLLAPFSREIEAFDVGLVVMEVWEAIAAEGYYLHPFGTIMSNVPAHDDFLKLAGIKNEDAKKNFMVFIYRAGKSKKPNSSLRIPVREHLWKGEHV